MQEYFKFDTNNQIQLGYESLEFPAVTICNVNPVRQSMLSTFSADFQDFVNKLDPATIGNIIDAVSKFIIY